MDGVVDVCKWNLNLTTWKAPKGLHSSIKLNVNLVKDVIASMAVVGSCNARNSSCDL